LCNPFERTVTGTVRLNRGFAGQLETLSPVERLEVEFALPVGKSTKWSRVRQVTMEETPERDLTIDADGWVNIEMGKKKILTIEFLP
jgi:hypothetical protein